jgi:hypothetical protein
LVGHALAVVGLQPFEEAPPFAAPARGESDASNVDRLNRAQLEAQHACPEEVIDLNGTPVGALTDHPVVGNGRSGTAERWERNLPLGDDCFGPGDEGSVI